MMMKWMIAIFVVLLLFIPSLSVGDWNATYHDLQNTSSTSENGPVPPFQILWKHLMSGGDLGDNNNAPLVHGNYVYDETRWALTAYDRTTGKVVWTKNVGGETDLIYYNGVIYGVSATYFDFGHGYVCALNATTGMTLWKITAKDLFAHPLPPNINWGDIYGFISNQGVIYRNNLVVVAFGNISGRASITMVFLNLSNGKVVKLHSFCDTNCTETEGIFLAEGYGNLYVEASSHAYAINLTNMNVLWKKDLGLQVYHRVPVIVGHGKVFFPAFAPDNSSMGGENEIIAFNAFTGKKIWEKVTGYGYEFGTMFYYSPIYDEIFTLVKGKTIRDVQNRPLTLYNLTAINGTTGKVVWTTRDKDWAFWTVSIVPTRRCLYVDAMGKSPKSPIYGSEFLRIYNITNGKLVYSFAIHSYGELGDSYFQYPQISVSNGTIYIPDNGMLYAIGSDAQNSSTLPWIYSVIATIVIVGIAITVLIVKKK